MSVIIEKPWGKEVIISPPNASYTGKIIYLTAGHRWSLQTHNIKSESFCLYSGTAKLITGPNPENLATIDMALLDGYTISPGTIHRIEALTDCVIFEASSPEVGTTTRIEDDYQRPDETEDIRNLPSRGWTQK